MRKLKGKKDVSKRVPRKDRAHQVVKLVNAVIENAFPEEVSVKEVSATCALSSSFSFLCCLIC